MGLFSKPAEAASNVVEKGFDYASKGIDAFFQEILQGIDRVGNLAVGMIGGGISIGAKIATEGTGDLNIGTTNLGTDTPTVSAPAQGVNSPSVRAEATVVQLESPSQFVGKTMERMESVLPPGVKDQVLASLSPNTLSYMQASAQDAHPVQINNDLELATQGMGKGVNRGAGVAV